MEAVKSPAGPPATYYLPDDDVNQANATAIKALAILDLIRGTDELDIANDTMQNLAWLLCDMVEELQTITNRKR